VEQELLTLPEHLSSHPVFSGVRVTRALIFCICFVDRCLSFCLLFFWSLCCLFFCLLIIVLSVLLSFDHCVVCSSVFWSLCCLFFCLLIIVLSVLLSFDHCVVCSSSIHGFWLPLWYLQPLLDQWLAIYLVWPCTRNWTHCSFTTSYIHVCTEVPLEW
jgi:hypothetical protein